MQNNKSHKKSNKKSISEKALCCFRSHKNKNQNAEHQMVDQRDSSDLNQSMLSDDHLNTNLGEGESGDISGPVRFQNPTSLSDNFNFNINVDINSSPRISPEASPEASPRDISDFNETFEVVPVAGLVPEDRNAPQDQDAGSVEDICEEEKGDKKDSTDNVAKEAISDAASDAVSDVINSPVNSENNSQYSSEDEIKALKNIELEIDMDLAEREDQGKNQEDLIEELKEELDVRAEKASNNEDEGQVGSQEGILSCSDIKLELVDGRNAHSESDLDALRKALEEAVVSEGNKKDNDSDSILANNGSRADTPIPALSGLERSVTSPKESALSPRTFEATRESSLSKSRSNNSFEENIL